jgi:hypothetical protein
VRALGLYTCCGVVEYREKSDLWTLSKILCVELGEKMGDEKRVIFTDSMCHRIRFPIARIVIAYANCRNVFLWLQFEQIWYVVN